MLGRGSNLVVLRRRLTAFLAAVLAAVEHPRGTGPVGSTQDARTYVTRARSPAPPLTPTGMADTSGAPAAPLGSAQRSKPGPLFVGVAVTVAVSSSTGFVHGDGIVGSVTLAVHPAALVRVNPY